MLRHSFLELDGKRMCPAAGVELIRLFSLPIECALGKTRFHY
jgi:hypothetical protein